MKLCNYSASWKAQILAAISVNIVAFSHGMALGWFSPVLPLLQSDASPLATGPLTVSQTSWIGSLICISGVFGVITGTILSDKLGRKSALNLLGLGHIGFWFIIYFGNAYYLIYVARLTSGFAGGAIFATIPLYIADISEPKVRGMMGTIFQLSYNTGILVSYIIGALVNYRTFPLVTFGVPVIFTILIFYFPETPQSLIKQKKLDDAKNSLKFYRGVPKDESLTKQYAEEFELMNSKFLNISDQLESKVTFRDFKSKVAIRGIAIGITLMFFNQFCGCFVLINYAAAIFRDTGSSLSPNLSSIIVAFMQICGSYTSTLLVDKVGRKILLLISMAGTSIGFAVCGTFSYLRYQDFDVSSFAIIPVISLSFVIFMGCLGILTLPYIILAEVLPAKLRSYGSLICLLSLLLFGFINLKFYPILSTIMHQHGCMWLFSGFGVLGVLFVVFILTETKGMNLLTAS